MKCWACDGSKKIPSFNKETDKIDFNNFIRCPVCDGTGEILQTNEEWFATLSTEEKAKVIVDLGREQRFPKDVEVGICEQWLKEVHKE